MNDDKGVGLAAPHNRHPPFWRKPAVPPVRAAHNAALDFKKPGGFIGDAEILPAFAKSLCTLSAPKAAMAGVKKNTVHLHLHPLLHLVS
jgi:hypothetical protein